jgi:hypothetical protein
MTVQFKNTSRQLTFFLQNASEGTIRLYHAPDGWDKSGYSYTRSKFYNGILRKYAINKLGFVKEGKAFIERVIATQGFEAEIAVIIWEEDFSTYSNFELFRGNLKLIGKDSSRLKINIPLVDSSFEDKLLNREDVDIITTKRTESEEYTDLDDKLIPGFSNEIQRVTLPERIDFLSSLMSSNRDLTYFSNEDRDPIIPILIKGDSNDDNVKSNSNEFKSVGGAFYINSTNADANIEMQGSVDFQIGPGIGGDPDNIVVTLFIINNSDIITTSVDIPIVKTLISSGFLGDVFSCVGEINISEIIPQNSYIQIGLMKEGTAGGMFANGTIIDFSIATQTDTTIQINVQTTLVHEAFARIGQKITGGNNPFYSTLFGRQNSEPRSYTFNGEDSLLAITNGANIRGFPMTSRVTSTEPISPLSISLKDLFSAVSMKRPIGMGIEAINGEKVFRIEELKYFFDTRIVLTIDNATEIEEEFNTDLIDNELEFGYTKFESDDILNGFSDYNTKSFWANAITTVKSALRKISKYSASNALINKARSVELSRENKPTTNTKYDDINFLIDVVDNRNSNAVLNPNADQGTTDWSITSGISTGLLLGNNKFILDQDNDGQVVMSQNLTAIDTIILSFSFAVISSDELTFTPTCRITARLNDNSIKYLNSNGDWVDDLVNINTQSIKGVLESQLQSMTAFEISSNVPLENINFIELSFNTDFLNNSTGINKYIIDDIYASDTAKYIARTTEGFDSITGIANSNDSYNILRTPARALKAWGYVIRAYLDDKLNTKLTFTNTEKVSTLVSKLSTETFEVAEGQDILVNDLAEPDWGIEKPTFTALLTAAQRRTINETFEDGKPKVHAIVQYRGNINEPYNHIWIDNLDLGGTDNVAKFEGRPVSKYVTISEEAIAIDDDEFIFTDDDINNEFTID